MTSRLTSLLASPSPSRLTWLSWLPAVVLVVIGFPGLWQRPPGDSAAAQAISYLIFGGGFAVAGATASRVCRASTWVPLLAGGTALLAGQVLSGAGADRWSDVLATTAVAVLLPLGVLRVPARKSGRPVLTALTALDGVIFVAGLSTVAAVATGHPAVAGGIGFAAGCVAFCTVWLQFELSSGDSRRQVLWIVLGGIVSALPVLLVMIVGDGPNLGVTMIAVLFGVLSLPFPAAVAIAAVDPRIVDVRRAISHTAVFGVMLALVVAAFSGASALVLVLNGNRQPVLGVSAVFCALIAAAYHPVRVHVQVTMDTLLFGGRADAVDVLTRLGSEFSAGSEPQDWLDSLRGAIAVPGIELRATAAGPVTASGTVEGHQTWSLMLHAGGDEVGELVVALPAEQLRLAPTTRAVLELVAGPLARALQAIRLAEDLKQSRGRVVAALEDERRRLRRDLHDGLGPTLTGIAYSADAAANLVRTDPDQAERLLRELRADTASAIAEIRRIVDGLRPRALDEFGVVEAVRRQVSRLRAADGRPLGVSITVSVDEAYVDADGDADEVGTGALADLPDLPAAVEVVAYRVAVEAVTNAARHSGSDAARVCFAVREGELQVAVDDAGRGGEWRPGVGLVSMRERVEAVGGRLDAAGHPDGGRVLARLPLTISN